MASGSLMANIKPKPLVLETRERSASGDESKLKQRIDQSLHQAEQAAAEGDVASAAKMILAALDAERRLASRGPQVLQLIKPRG